MPTPYFGERHKKTKQPLNSNKPGGLVLNKKGLRNFKEIAYENQGIEFLYLRENEFFNWDPYVALNRLKVLDLSINSLVNKVDFLYQTPNLRHLYLTGNRINSLDGISGLENLETLCLSDNEINSFEGLDNLPNLRVLSLNFNNINNFRHYPFLPELHTLNMIGNPIAEIPEYRRMAIASTSPTLQKLDTRPVTAEEQQDVQHYAGKLVYCVTEGLVIDGSNPEAQADEFLHRLQRETWQDRALALQSIYIASSDGHSQLRQGVEVKLNCCLQDIRPAAQRRDNVFRCASIHPVQFKVVGDASEVFVVGQMNRWQEKIPLERCSTDGEVYFHTTLYLPAGEYEYRYIIDGEQSVDPAKQCFSKHDNGKCNIYSVVDPPNATQDRTDTTILYVRWLRCNSSNGFDVIENENSLRYIPTQDDIGVCLRAEVLAYINSDFSFLYFDISNPVQQGPPRCQALTMGSGTQFVEGEAVSAKAVYTGGIPGKSKMRWYRIRQDEYSGRETEEPILEMSENPFGEYALKQSDVGRRIKVEYVPVRADGEFGPTAVFVSPEIKPGVPTCLSMSIGDSDVREGRPITVETVYAGGFEGNSRYQWFRQEAGDNWVAIPGETSATYTPTASDYKKRLAVEYVPVSVSGVVGGTSRCHIDSTVLADDPHLTKLKITGQLLQEQYMLMADFEYKGGAPGKHDIEWYALSTDGRQRRVGMRGEPTVNLSHEDIGCRISVEVTPVRDDGVRGPKVTDTTEGVVRSAAPTLRLFSLNVTDKSDNPVDKGMVGAIVTVQQEYFGGMPGQHEII